MDPDPDNLYACFSLICFPLLTFLSNGMLASIILVIFLLIGSALISSSEVAFFSLTATDFQKLENETSPSAQRILLLKEFPRRLLATILISNNFINIAIVIISDFIIRGILPVEQCVSWMNGLPKNWLIGLTINQCGSYLHFAITVIGVTFLLVLFGEVAPKVYAKLNNMKIARIMSGPLMHLSALFSPISVLLVKGTKLIEKRLARRTQSSNLTSKEDIDQAIELTVKDEQQEIDILKGIVKFGEVSVKQIMRSRVDVIAVDFRTPFNELIDIIKKSGYSRIPVYDEDFDNITGILYVKDLLKYLNEKSNFEWQGNIRSEIHYVPEAKKISDLLKEFQTKRQHMAVVVDEYGGSSGIVTLEDIMEEVIGEIQDEFDDIIEVEYSKVDEFTYIFEGKTLLNDVCRIIGADTNTFDDHKGDSDSLAGLILEIVGFIPRKGRVIMVEKHRLEALAVSKRRIEQVKITLPKKKK